MMRFLTALVLALAIFGTGVTILSSTATPAQACGTCN